MEHVLKMNYRDVTRKARLHDSLNIKARLLQVGARFVGTDQQVDQYFDVPRGKLKWRQGTIENLITHYERILEDGFEHTVVYRYDVNPSPEAIKELCDHYQSLSSIRKQRSIYWLGPVKIHIDALPDGNEFIEWEAIDREGNYSIRALKAHCVQIQHLLGIDKADLLPTGYFQKKT